MGEWCVHRPGPGKAACVGRDIGQVEQKFCERALESSCLVSNPASTSFWPNDLGKVPKLICASSFLFLQHGDNNKGLLLKVARKIPKEKTQPLTQCRHLPSTSYYYCSHRCKRCARRAHLS